MCLAASIITVFNVCFRKQSNFTDFKLFHNATFGNLCVSFNFEIVFRLQFDRKWKQICLQNVFFFLKSTHVFENSHSYHSVRITLSIDGITYVTTYI